MEAVPRSSQFFRDERAGGANSISVYDAGTITATLTSLQEGTYTTPVINWGQGSTPNSIAQALAAAIQSASEGVISAQASGLNGGIQLTSAMASKDSNFTVSVNVTDTVLAYLSTPSFSATATNMSGSSTGSYAQVYSYQVPTGGYAPNGNLLQSVDSVMGAWSYGYDTVNRVATAASNQAGNSYPSYCWQYDSFGNRLGQTSASAAFASDSGGANACTVSGAAGPSQIASYTTSNQMISTSYDAAGDVTGDGRNQYAYDAEGRICAVYNGVTMTGYLYGADGARVASGSLAGALTPTSANPFTAANYCNPITNGFTPTKEFLLDQNGNQVTELSVAGNTASWAHSNAWIGGHLTATYDVKGLHFHIADPLGSRRVQLNPSGTVENWFSSLPFGDALTTISNSKCLAANGCFSVDPTEHHFTGKERDTESGNDYFGARYYASNMGRFMSPDPAGPWAADVSDPQSWNFYAYARNNPLINVDFMGYDCVYLNDAGTGIDKNGIDTHSNSGECGDHGGYWVDGTFMSGTVYSNNNDVYLHGYDSSTGQLTNSYSNVVTTNGSSPINTALRRNL
jgi:RHS repeat-associated protein